MCGNIGAINIADLVNGVASPVQPVFQAIKPTAAPVPVSNSALNGTESFTAPTSLYNPALGNVQQNQLVSSNLNGLIDSNSDYMKRAQALSTQKANSRGLINSTMAAQAGTAAAIDAAMPIAQADANVYNQTANANLGYMNSANQYNATAMNDNAQKQLQRQNDILINQMGISSTAAQSSYDTTLKAITGVQTSADLDAGAKQGLVDQIVAWQRAQAQNIQSITGNFAGYL